MALGEGVVAVAATNKAMAEALGGKNGMSAAPVWAFRGLFGGALAALFAISACSQGKKPPTTIAADTLIYNDSDNVVVFSPQVGVNQALDNDGGSVSARFTVDALSSASVDVVSSATYRFSEIRYEGDVAATKKFGKWQPSVGYRTSYEPDYRSHGVRYGLARRVTGDTTVSANLSSTFDRIGRTGTPFSNFSRNLFVQSADVSLAQNLSRNTVVRAAYSFTGQFGYMEKPYRSVPLFTEAAVAQAQTQGGLNLENFSSFSLGPRPLESVPDQRYRHALGVRGLHYLEKLRGSVGLDYRIYLDSWGMHAHTMQPGLKVELGRKWMVSAWTRFHWQSSVSFWQRSYVVPSAEVVPRWRSADRSLSRSWHTTPGVRAEYDTPRFAFYGDLSIMFSRFPEFMYLDRRTAGVFLIGARWKR